MNRRCYVSIGIFFVVAATPFYAGCGRERSAESRSEHQPRRDERSGAEARPARSPEGRTVYATWYDVPDGSLAARRAAPGELTAAHDRLPLGARVRVTHLGSGKSVVVRITDRGVHSRKGTIDLCRRAADELGMIGEGRAKVRMELLHDDSDDALAGGGTRPQAAVPQP